MSFLSMGIAVPLNETVIGGCYSLCADKHWGGSNWIAAVWIGLIASGAGVRVDKCLSPFLSKMARIVKKVFGNSEEGQSEAIRGSSFPKKRIIATVAATISIIGITLIITGVFQGILATSPSENCLKICMEAEDLFSPFVNCSSLEKGL